MLFGDAMKLLWLDSVKRKNILLFVTDAALVLYLKGIQLLYSKIVHILCLAHGLHTMDEMFEANYTNVDRLIANKKMFLKALL